MTTSIRCLRCRYAALLTSAAVHLTLAAALLQGDLGQAPVDDAAAPEVGVTLAMFADRSPPGDIAAAPAEMSPAPPMEPAPEPISEPAQEEVPEPITEQVPEQAPEAIPVPEPAPEPTPQIAAEPPLESVARALEQKPARAAPKAKPKPARTQRPKVAAAQPREARAQPVAAQPAAAPASPAPGGGSGSVANSASVAALEGDYLRGLQRAIARNRFYPPDARRRDVTGVVTVSFTVQSDGRLGDIRVAKGSGFEMLDQAALETLRRLGSYKPIPAATGKTRWPVRVPIVFDLR